MFPFVTRELLELAFELHPSELVGPGTKRLLRYALAGDVPAKNLQRPDKGHPGSGEAPAPAMAGGGAPGRPRPDRPRRVAGDGRRSRTGMCFARVNW